MDYTVPDHVLALLWSGFSSAGDGGPDHFSAYQRREVELALAPIIPKLEQILKEEVE